jgi:hypothetical protein
MIDNFSIALTHAMMLYVAWRMINMPQVDDESVPPPEEPKKAGRWGR